MEPDPAVLTEVAARVAAEAADLVRTARADISAGRGVAVDTKTSDTDVVTAVDHDSERFVRRRLAELRPGDPVLGEEGGGEVGTESAEGSAAVTWVVDPIDGTVNFLYGFPVFAVSVAAQVGGVSVAGAVVEPVSGRRWTATRGAGAWLDGEPLRVSRPAGLDQALLATGFAYQVRRRARQARLMAGVLEHVRDIRRAGAASLDLCAVAAGWHDAYFEHGLNRWDWAAGALIAAEAGAVVSLPGEDPQLGADATLAASPAVASALRAVLVDCGAADV
ncbi:inositol monophosphatase family protein [Prauserella shujinwangii]|uniref:inositol monophosphatase family protein n=1 Tax=Prauserella shujinwangii TaxID=1453103 RepID=UPI000D0797CB|nr:inositol monophosphatase family protein [Prauserella shujinwangii]